MPRNVQWKRRLGSKRNLAPGLVLDKFTNMKTRTLLTIIMTVALFAVGRAVLTPPPSVADIKMLAKGGISEEVILEPDSEFTCRLPLEHG